MDNISKNKLKWLRSLRLEKNRRKEKRFIVYGEKIVSELIDENPDLVEFVASVSEDLCLKFNGEKISAKEMEMVSELKTPGTILAVVKYPEISSAKSDLILILDGIRDPGNLGTIIRTADWFGVQTIFCSEDTVSMTNPKVVQASMGSVFRTAVIYGNLTEMMSLDPRPVYGALLEGEPVNNSILKLPAYLVIGSEGTGISSELRAHVTHAIKIPSFGQAESLNASIACGILLSIFRLS